MKQDEKTLDNRERQRKFKAKLYKAGFKQMLVWIKRSPKKRAGNMDQKTFIGKLK
jgi:G:T-mismatch repair DNA endonuclease (very short patch repair protein)